MTAQTRRRAALLTTAFHEAGHAVQALAEGGRTVRATIVAGHDSAGSVIVRLPRPNDTISG